MHPTAKMVSSPSPLITISSLHTSLFLSLARGLSESAGCGGRRWNDYSDGAGGFAAPRVSKGPFLHSSPFVWSSSRHPHGQLLDQGIHPTTIVEGFQQASALSVKILREMASPVDLSDRDSLIASAATSLSSKVVAQYSSLLAPLAVDAVRHVIDTETATNVDLHDIRVVKKVGGTIDDTELVQGLVLTQTSLTSPHAPAFLIRSASKVAGGPSRVKDAKIGLIQFQLSPPKSNVLSPTSPPPPIPSPPPLLPPIPPLCLPCSVLGSTTCVVDQVDGEQDRD